VRRFQPRELAVMSKEVIGVLLVPHHLWHEAEERSCWSSSEDRQRQLLELDGKAHEVRRGKSGGGYVFRPRSRCHFIGRGWEGGSCGACRLWSFNAGQFPFVREMEKRNGWGSWFHEGKRSHRRLGSLRGGWCSLVQWHAVPTASWLKVGDDCLNCCPCCGHTHQDLLGYGGKRSTYLLIG
jgi:hypothetical protein